MSVNDFRDMIGKAMWNENEVGEFGMGPMYLKNYAKPSGDSAYFNWLKQLLKRIEDAHKEIDTKTHGNNENGVEEPTEWEQAVIDCMDRVDDIRKERESALGRTCEMKNSLVDGLLSQLTPAKQHALNNAQGTVLNQIPNWMKATSDSDSSRNGNSTSDDDDDDDDDANKPSYVDLIDSDNDNSNAVSLEQQKKPETKKGKDKNKDKKMDKKMGKKRKKEGNEVKRKKRDDADFGANEFIRSFVEDDAEDKAVLKQTLQILQQQQQQQQQQQHQQQFFTPNSYEISNTTPSTMTTESTTPLKLTADICLGKIKNLEDLLSGMKEGELAGKYRDMINKHQVKYLELLENEIE